MGKMTNRADGRTARQWYADQYADLRDHAAVFSSTWTYCGVRTLIEKSRDQHDRKNFTSLSCAELR